MKMNVDYKADKQQQECQVRFDSYVADRCFLTPASGCIVGGN